MHDSSSFFLASLLVAGGCSGFPDRAWFRMTGTQLSSPDRPDHLSWSFRIEAGRPREAKLRFRKDGEALSFESLRVETRGESLVLEPMRGQGEVLLSSRVVEKGITADFELAPAAERSAQPSQTAQTPRGLPPALVLTLKTRLTSGQGEATRVFSLPVTRRPLEKLGRGYSSIRGAGGELTSGELFFLSHTEDGGGGYLSCDALMFGPPRVSAPVDGRAKGD